MAPLKKHIRLFAVLAITMGLLACSHTPVNPTPTSEEITLLVSGYTHSEDEGISLITVNRTGERLTIKDRKLLASANRPNYLYFKEDTQQLYSVGFREKKQAAVRLYHWDSTTQQFSLKQDLALEGKGICHISMHPSNSAIVTSNYGTGDLSVVNLESSTGRFDETQYFKNIGKSLKPIQQSPRLHFGQWSSDGKYLYAADLGTDEILVFESSKSLRPKFRTKLDAGDGPRHLAFHTKNPWVYSLNELSNTLTVFERDVKSGALKHLNKLALLTPEETASVPLNAASAIRSSSDGKFLYLAVRGVDEIQVFDIQQEKPKRIQKIGSGGHWPRDFNFSIDQTLFMVANQKSNQINFFQRNIETGKLRLLDLTIAATNPSFIQEVNLAPK